MSDNESKILAIKIVSYRLFGINKEDSIKAMEELLLKKANGSEFDYEKYIDEAIKAAPKSTGTDLSMFGNIVSMFNGRKI